MANIIRAGMALPAALALVSCGESKRPDNRSVLEVTTSPSGAAVTIDGRKCGSAPVKVLAPAGDHIIKAGLPGYRSEWSDAQCRAKGHSRKHIKLKPEGAAVMLVSQPKGAAVEMNGEVVGETPLVSHDLALGRHQAILKLPNHVPKQVEWTVENARPQKISAKLVSNVGVLAVISKPSEAFVFIDDEARGRSPFQGQLEHGNHKVRLEAPGYAVHEEVVFITRGGAAAISPVLALLPGGLKINSTPAGAEVSVNGDSRGATPLELDKIEPGAYELVFEKSGCDPVYRQVEVSPGQTAVVAVDLESNLGGIDLVANPPGVTVYVDGVKAGISEPGAGDGIAKIMEVRGLSPGRHSVLAAHKLATPPQKEFNVTVKKGQVTRMPNIDMWIADTVLVLKDGAKYTGRIRHQNEYEVIFEPHPAIASRYDRKEIKSIQPRGRRDE